LQTNKKGGKRNHAQKTDQNPALEGDSESGKQHVGAIIFAILSFFTLTNGRRMIQQKNKRELGRQSLKN
jgi:hypothetical protein